MRILNFSSSTRLLRLIQSFYKTAENDCSVATVMIVWEMTEALMKYLLSLIFYFSILAEEERLLPEPPKILEESLEQSPGAKALWFLKKQQLDNGSWENDVSLTSLCLLAYLSSGETPKSKWFGESVSKSMIFLNQSDLSKMTRREKLMILYALSESYSMTGNYKIAEFLEGNNELVAQKIVVKTQSDLINLLLQCQAV